MAASSRTQTSRVPLLAAVLLLATATVSASASLGLGAVAATVDAPPPDAFGDTDDAIEACFKELTSAPVDLSIAARMGKPGKPTNAGPTTLRMAVKTFLKQKYSAAWGVTPLDVDAKRAYTISTDARRHAAAWIKAYPETSNTALGVGTVMGKASATASTIVAGHPKHRDPQPTGSFRAIAAAYKKTVIRAVAVTMRKSLLKGLLPSVVAL